MKDITVEIRGSFGNQLFCYAFGYALSKRLDVNLRVVTATQDNKLTRMLELPNFDLPYNERVSYTINKEPILGILLLDKVINKFVEIIRREKAIGFLKRKYKEKQPTVFDAKVFTLKRNTYLYGYWQSEKYFKEYRQDLIRLFTPMKKRSEEVLELIEKMQHENSVSVHVRRGDYIDNGWTVDMKFYDQAIEKIIAKYADLIFYVFSDDIPFCQTCFLKWEGKINICYPTYKSDNYALDDMWLMSKCKHNIIANSTYSWWAAWLNQNEENMVICPEFGIWSYDFYPEEWYAIKI